MSLHLIDLLRKRTKQKPGILNHWLLINPATLRYGERPLLSGQY